MSHMSVQLYDEMRAPSGATCTVLVSAARASAQALAREPGLDVAGVATNGEAAERLARTLLPDVALVQLRGAHGVAAATTRRVRSASPTARVAILTTSDAAPHLYDTFKAGASGHANLNRGAAEIAAAARSLAAGKPDFPSHLASEALHDLEAAGAMYLTATERALLEAVAQGLSGDEVTESLRLDVDVVHRTVESMLTKRHSAEVLDLEAPNRWPMTATNLAAPASCPSPIG